MDLGSAETRTKSDYSSLLEYKRAQESLFDYDTEDAVGAPFPFVQQQAPGAIMDRAGAVGSIPVQSFLWSVPTRNTTNYMMGIAKRGEAISPEDMPDIRAYDKRIPSLRPYSTRTDAIQNPEMRALRYLQSTPWWQNTNYRTHDPTYTWGIEGQNSRLSFADSAQKDWEQSVEVASLQSLRRLPDAVASKKGSDSKQKADEVAQSLGIHVPSPMM
jgi:hypothetical protein